MRLFAENISTTANSVIDDNPLYATVRDNRFNVGGSRYVWKHLGSFGRRYPNLYNTGNKVTGAGTWDTESPV
ncbi:hypothetical protein FXB40_28095 [Bradyrhizobium rifense]|uniref:Uncharacterized protein n=1 Tax=Bradyrhizobium rifense TaxID=515499 RepID=A0A5D3KKK3_9BRAD|nr:hypothetical protein [Bradyrhizobium rifense]TYL91778.1 hypothetical protein FXB40_28095 [Bradyrhizobium rifense]